MSDRKGVALLVVISMILMLAVLSASILLTISGHFGSSFHQIRRARALYVAEAAMQHALWACRSGDYDLTTNSWPITETITVFDPTISLSADISVHPQGEDPLGIGSVPPANTYPIVITVQY